jgi:hypothetical protein
MKLRSGVIFTAALLGLASVAAAAPAPKAPVGPDYNGVFEGRKVDSGERLILERTTPAQRSKIRAFGYGGASVYVEIPGATSSVRIPAGQKVEFVVRVPDQETDPNTTIKFLSFKKVGATRAYQMANVGAMGLRTKMTQNDNAVAFNAEKYGPKFFKITPSQPLAPGEYCLNYSSEQASFCFGID